MKKIIIDTDRQAVLLKVTIKVDRPSVLKFRGYDSRIEDSNYITRGFGTPEKPFSGTKTFCFPMPLSPKRLVFEVTSPNSDNDIKVLGVEKLKLRQADVWLTPDTQEFFDFAKDFVKKASYYLPGVYVRESKAMKGREFIISYKNELLDGDGNPVNTPARISRSTGIVEVNRRKFLSYSIPMRLIILMHEFVHWKNNTRIELECDKNAINLLLLSGFAKTEVMYAFTKIFMGKNHLANRVEEIVKFIDSPRYAKLNEC